MALKRELGRIVEQLKEKYDPEKIIVFGSFAEGKTKRWSDLDIAIIKETNKRFLDRLDDVNHIVDRALATDFFVYTPQEFAEMTRENYFVRDEIVRKGILLYDKNNSS